MNNMSAHIDANEIVAWLRALPASPRRTFIVHGESAGADSLRHCVEEGPGWPRRAPEYREVARLA